MRRTWILAGSLVILVGAALWFLAWDGHRPGPAVGSASDGAFDSPLDLGGASSPSKGVATDAERPLPKVPDPGPETGTPRPAKEGDPFGSMMFEVRVVNRRGQPIVWAAVQSVRGNATTDKNGHAWIPPLGVDFGSPTRDHRYKTLTVSASGYVTLRHWVDLSLSRGRNFATLQLLKEVSEESPAK